MSVPEVSQRASPHNSRSMTTSRYIATVCAREESLKLVLKLASWSSNTSNSDHSPSEPWGSLHYPHHPIAQPDTIIGCTLSHGSKATGERKNCYRHQNPGTFKTSHRSSASASLGRAIVTQCRLVLLQSQRRNIPPYFATLYIESYREPRSVRNRI